MLLVAATLAVLIGIAHSFLGEKYILMRLFRQSLPPLFGDDWFTRQTLRFAWHATTVAWWGFAALLALLHFGKLSGAAILYTIAVVFAVSGVIALAASRGRHLSWLVFGAISVICFVQGST